MATATVDRWQPSAAAASGPITTRLWRTGEPPARVELDGARLGEHVLHFDVASCADPFEVYDALRPICGDDLTLAMVQDLVDPDEMPKIKPGDEARRIRSLSAFGVQAAEGRLVFNVVEFLSNDRWLITCSHRAGSYAGSGLRTAHRSSYGCTDMMDAVARRWTERERESAGDLGILFLYELTCSYSAAVSELMAWVDDWERRFYYDSRIEQSTIKEVRGLATEFRGRLNLLDVRREDAGSSWFSGVSDPDLAKRADAHIDQALDRLERLSDMLRSALGLVQAQHSDQLSRKVEVVTVVFLVPTLIAGMWGENTWVPGQGKPWGFALTIGTMVLGALLAHQLMRFIRRGRSSAA